VCKREVNPKSCARDDLLWMTLADRPPVGHLAGMSLTTTLVAALALVALAVFAGWRGAQPPDLAKGVRMVPWRGVMLTASLGAMLLLVHVINLLGFTTGRP
jgi:hypothetical protein